MHMPHRHPVTLSAHLISDSQKFDLHEAPQLELTCPESSSTWSYEGACLVSKASPDPRAAMCSFRTATRSSLFTGSPFSSPSPLLHMFFSRTMPCMHHVTLHMRQSL